MESFIDNIIFVYFFSCIAILDYDNFVKSQKLSLIYAITFAMQIFTDTHTSVILLSLLFFMFILEEYLNSDQGKILLVTSIQSKIFDFIFEFIFQDAGLMISLTIILSCSHCEKCFENTLHNKEVFYIFICILFFVTIHVLNTNRFYPKSFTELKSHFDRYVYKDLDLGSSEVRERLEMLAELEDQSYFVRENSYNWVSREFLQYKLNQNSSKKKKRKINLWRYVSKIIWTLRNRGVKECLHGLYVRLSDVKDNVMHCILSIKRRVRGCSTLEMQFIRVNGIAQGYNCVFRRKIYELVYSYIFFSGLKRYYTSTITAKKQYFKEFILYVYIYSIPVRINGNRFSCIAEVFRKQNDLLNNRSEFSKFGKEELYVAYLALTGAKVTEKRLMLYPDTINRHHLDSIKCYCFLKLIDEQETSINGIGIHEELEKMCTCIKDSKVQPFYSIAGVFLPYILDSRNA